MTDLAEPRLAEPSTSSSSEIVASLGRLSANIESVFLGKPDVVRHCLVGLVAGGHLLIEDVPGVGKTVLGRALAASLSGSFARVQFTPDLLPGDVLGVSVYDTARGDFDFKKGPIFSNVVLADEINRTTPRTQSALLEAMNEGQVSSDGRTFPLPEPFLVIATQNPYEFEGTYPLPENQLDRFMLRLRVGYPAPEHERDILRGISRGPTGRAGEKRTGLAGVGSVPAVITGREVITARAAADEIHVSETLYDHILELAHATRREPSLRYGVSTRGTLALLKAAKVSALLAGRSHLIPDDVRDLVEPVWAHRLVARARLLDRADEHCTATLRAILAAIPSPP